MPATRKPQQLKPLSPLPSPVLLPTPLPSPTSPLELRKPALKSALRRTSGEKIASTWAFPSCSSAPADQSTFERAPRGRTLSTPFHDAPDSAASTASSTLPSSHKRTLSAHSGDAAAAAAAFARANRRRAGSPPPRASSPPPPVPPLPASVLLAEKKGASVIVRATRISRAAPVVLATPPSTPPSTPPMALVSLHKAALTEDTGADRISDIVDLYVHDDAQTPRQASPGLTCAEPLAMA